MQTTFSLLLLLAIDGLPEVEGGEAARHRRLITAGLLTALQAANDLGLTPADPEAEALLLYRPGPVPAPVQVLAQARRLFETFHHWITDFQRSQPCGCLTCRTVTGLNLRIVAHAGPVAFATGQGPYGDALRLLYDLLVDKASAHEHVLLTDALLGAEREAAGFWAGARRGSFSAGQLGDVGYVSVVLRDPNEPFPYPPASPIERSFFNPYWPLELPGLPDRLALN